MAIIDVPTVRQIALLELKALDVSSNAEVTLYFSNSSYVTTPTDTPANTAYIARLSGAPSLDRKMYSSNNIGGLVSQGIGNISLYNGDGGLDYIYDDYLILGREFTYSIISLGDTHENKRLIFSGVVNNARFGEQSLELVLSGKEVLLDQPLSPTKYCAVGGVGQVTFNSSLHGRNLPVSYGVVKNVTPTYIARSLAGLLKYSEFDGASTSSSVTISGGGLVATHSGDSDSWATIYATIGAGDDLQYFEIDTAFSSNGAVGVSEAGPRVFDEAIGDADEAYGFEAATGNLISYGSSAPYSSAYIGGTRIGVAVDLVEGKLWFSRNGIWDGNPSAGTDPAASGLKAPLYVAVSLYDVGDSVTAVFDPDGTVYPTPSGFNTNTTLQTSVMDKTYQVHKSTIYNIICVHSNGADLAESEYYTEFEKGTFTVTAASAQSITADVHGDIVPAIPEGATDIMKELVIGQLTPPQEIDGVSFNNLLTPYFAGVSILTRATTGYYNQTGQSVGGALKELLNSFGLFGGFNRKGVFDIGLFKGQTESSSVASLTDVSIIEASRQKTSIPKYRRSLGYARNYTPMTPSAIAPTVLLYNPDQYAFLLAPWRVVTADTLELGIRKVDSVVEAIPEGGEDDYHTIQDRYPTAEEGNQLPSNIFSGVDALLENKRRWRLYNSAGTLLQPSRLSMVVKALAGSLELNDTLMIKYPRFGLDTEVPYCIIGISEDTLNNIVTLDLWSGSESSIGAGTDVDVAAIEASFVQYDGCSPIIIAIESDLHPYGLPSNPYGMGTRPFGS